MLEIGIHGQRGQGTREARRILAGALFEAGREVHVFVASGQDEHADHALVFDPTLLGDLGPASLREGAVVVVNSPAAPCGFGPRAAQIVDVDASRIAAEAGLGPLVAPALLGAFAAATDLLRLDELTAAVEASGSAKRAACADACTAGFIAVRAARGSGVTVTS